jgi:hypothetical protein
MKTRTSRKLTISRETLFELGRRSLEPLVGGVISDASNCQHCQTVAPCLETGTCWEQTLDGCYTVPPTVPSVTTNGTASTNPR